MSMNKEFTGPLAKYLQGLLDEKRSLGFKYREQERLLGVLDKMSISFDCSDGLSKELCLEFVKKDPNWHQATQENRVALIRVLAEYMIRHDVPAYMLDFSIVTRQYEDFKPYIFNHDEIHDIFCAADNIKPHASKSHIFYPTLLRVQYGCGLRISETLNLTMKDVDFEIKKGKSTAIVGLSGSGKTTLLKLLLGFYTPDVGTITIGGISLLDYDIREWRKKCGVVMQDGFVYSDTIARNIVPSGEIDKKRLILAARMANVLSFVATMPLGFHTKIGGEGKGLSSGQKQRLLIARAIYKNPDYLFLDEATNSLDANNEREVMGNLKSFLQGRTSVIIAHRLSTVKDADHIVVMKSGHVVEQGTHQTLLDKKGVYYSLIKNQLAV